jgi:uncharacterized protein (DUF952 family)
MAIVYKICGTEEWRAAETDGVFGGSAADHHDGFIHLSTAAQVRETAARHFAGRDDLILAAVDATLLGSALRYETSRGGALFPHLYGDLDLTAVAWVRRLPLDENGRHVFPDPLL